MGSPKTRHKARQVKRKKLLAQGLPPAEVEALVLAQYPLAAPAPQRARRGRRSPEAIARRHDKQDRIALARVEADRLERLLKAERDNQARRIAQADRAQEERERETYERLQPDDSRHRPTTPDPLKTGAARATGMTAKVASRKNTVTKWQYDSEVAR